MPDSLLERTAVWNSQQAIMKEGGHRLELQSSTELSKSLGITEGPTTFLLLFPQPAIN